MLPTGGTAAFASGLNTLDFLKSVQEIEYTREALLSLEEPLRALAVDEDLPAHADTVTARNDAAPKSV